MGAILLCIAAMAVVAHATEVSIDKSEPKPITVEIAGGPTIFHVLKDSKPFAITKGEKRQFPGDCEVVCKDDCKTTTKCTKTPITVEVCTIKPIIRVKEVCKDVCKDPAHGVSIYGKGRRLFTTTIDLGSLLSGDKKGDADGKDGKSTGFQVCEKKCKEEEVDDTKEECKTVEKEKEECKDDKKCSGKICKCVVQSPGSNGNGGNGGNGGSGDMSFTLDSFKPIQINKPDKSKEGMGGPMFGFNVNIDKSKEGMEGPNFSFNANIDKSKEGMEGPMFSFNANVDKKGKSVDVDAKASVGH